jgi:hypothetical protein
MLNFNNPVEDPLVVYCTSIHSWNLKVYKISLLNTYITADMSAGIHLGSGT